MEIITSRQNPKVKSIASLLDKKGRERQRLFRFDGIKLFADSLAKTEIEQVILRHPLSETVEKVVGEALSSGAIGEDKLMYVSDSVFEKLTDELSPEGIITVARYLDMLHVKTADVVACAGALSGKRLLLGESLRDPGNLGTIMRSSAALGIDCLVISDDCADIYNPKTLRSSMGAIFRLPTVRMARNEMPSFVEALKNEGRQVYAAALRENAERIGELSLFEGDCFIIGNEGHGLSEMLIAASSGAAIIPMVEGNESLNAAAAATVCIWETVRASGKRTGA